MTDDWAILIWLIVIPVLFVGFLIYMFFFAWPAQTAWENQCRAKGGTPVPTQVTTTKTGDSYGRYVCADLKIITISE